MAMEKPQEMPGGPSCITDHPQPSAMTHTASMAANAALVSSRGASGRPAARTRQEQVAGSLTLAEATCLSRCRESQALQTACSGFCILKS